MATWLTDDEVDAVVLAAIPAEGATEDDILKVVDWAERVRTEGAFLDAVLAGKVSATWSEEEKDIVFHTKEER